jgi:uncharacterized protein YcbK (DUF882 family)
MALTISGAAISCRALPAVQNPPERSLSLYHTHTGERLSVVYFKAGSYIRDAREELNFFLRDFRNGKVVAIDVRVLDQLSELSQSLKAGGVFEIISGYRSPETNAMLRKNNEGVAGQSLHMQGKAVDVRLAGVPLSCLKSAALTLACGGVGYYPKSGFIHLDTGRVRNW